MPRFTPYPTATDISLPTSTFSSLYTELDHSAILYTSREPRPGHTKRRVSPRSARQLQAGQGHDNSSSDAVYDVEATTTTPADPFPQTGLPLLHARVNAAVTGSQCCCGCDASTAGGGCCTTVAQIKQLTAKQRQSPHLFTPSLSRIRRLHSSTTTAEGVVDCSTLFTVSADAARVCTVPMSTTDVPPGPTSRVT